MINSPEKIKKVIRISNNQLQLLAGGVYKVGARFLTNAAALTLDRTVSGLGGLDSGAIAASTLYYVYVVQSGGVPFLIASTSEVSPVGYTNYRKVGAFYTDTSSNIFRAYPLGFIVNKTLSAFLTTALTFQHNTDELWISSIGLATSTFTITLLSGVLSQPPFVVATWSRTDASGIVRVNSASASQVVTQSYNDAGANTSADQNLVVRKQGIDAVQPDWNQY